MKKAYETFCKVEETLVKVFLMGIVVFVFSSAIFRTIGSPLNWAVDMSMLFFAWMVFLGADVAMRHTELVNVDLFFRRFPDKAQMGIYLLWQVLILAFLGMLVAYGVPLTIESSKRLFQTMTISYSWATLSVPVGSVLMMVTTVIKIVRTWTTKTIGRGGAGECC
ncbi:TRAP transporter small permease [Anaerotalea alkaliphila]|nr:TRAP transporter small permease subunit [Anaerotalea alkaliphila]